MIRFVRTGTRTRTRTTGSLGFGLGRETEIICGVREGDDSFETMSYTFGAKDMGWEKEVSEWVRMHCDYFLFQSMTPYRRGLVRSLAARFLCPLWSMLEG